MYDISEVARAPLPAFPNDDLGTWPTAEALASEEEEEDLEPLRVSKCLCRVCLCVFGGGWLSRDFR